MSNFHYTIAKDLASVKKELASIMTQEIKKDYVKPQWDGDNLVIKIEKMGSSEIRFALYEQGGSVHIQEKKRSISLLHKAFVGDVERAIQHLLGNKLGAVQKS